MKARITNRSKLLVASISCAGLLLAGCGDTTARPPGADHAENAETSSTTSVFPASLIVDEAPADALNVAEARKQAQAGSPIVLTGFIGARREPFVDGRAILTLGDTDALTTCDQREDDSCKTPWDACCDPRETIQASIASIQVVDAEGRVLPAGLKGVGGMEELSLLTVEGTVAESSSPEALIVNADQIHVGVR